MAVKRIGPAIAMLTLALAGCGLLPSAAPDDPKRPEARPEPSAVQTVPENARTAEEFDVTTPEERAAAVAPTEGEEVLLGTTIAVLGDVSQPGFWIQTPLARDAGPGRVALEGSNRSAQVELLPIPGPATGGSRLSLSAMQLLGVPLSDLVKLEVYAQE